MKTQSSLSEAEARKLLPSQKGGDRAGDRQVTEQSGVSARQAPGLGTWRESRGQRRTAPGSRNRSN